MIKICVLMSSYNGEKYIAEQIDSILNQKFDGTIELIVRDDGSTDRTKEILDVYQDKGQLRWYTGNNLGCVYSFFDLLRNAPEADYYAFADQDDFWLDEKLQRAVSILKKDTNLLLYCSKKQIVDKTLKSLQQADIEPLWGNLDVLMKGNRTSGCTMVWPQVTRNLFMMSKPKGDLYHDTWLFNLAYFCGRVYFDFKPYILYRQHGSNVVGAMPSPREILKKRLQNIDLTFSKYKNRNKARTYARFLLDNYSHVLSSRNKRLLWAVVNSKQSFKERIYLLQYGVLSKHPFYEYLVYKFYIIMGWV